MTNSNKLKAYMVEAGYTQRELAKEAGMSVNSLNMKINNVRPFDCEEAKTLCKILGITDGATKSQIFLC